MPVDVYLLTPLQAIAPFLFIIYARQKGVIFVYAVVNVSRVIG